MKKAAHSHAMSGVFIFMLLGIFAIMSTLLVLLGAQAYRAVVDSAARNAEERILLSYPANKVRMNDDQDHLRVEDVDGTKTLVISQDFDGSLYETRIYCYDGWLYEVFQEHGDEIALEDGEALTQAAYFRPEIKNGLLTFEVGTPEGAQYRMNVALRSQAAKGATT